MANNVLSKVRINNVDYDVKDAQARTDIGTINTNITNLQSGKQDKITDSSKLAASLVSFEKKTGSKLTSTNVNDALGELESAIDSGGTGSVVSVVKQETAETDYAATYYVTQGGTQVGVKINIPKDYLVKSATLKEVTKADDPYTGAKVGDKYIDFVVNTNDKSGNESHIYLPVNDLVDVYKADGTTLSLNTTTNTFSVATSLMNTINAKALNSDLTAEINRAKAAEALKANTADLGEFATVDTGTATVASKTVSGVKATGIVSGNATVSLSQTPTAATLTKADYTPSGSITGTAIKGGSISVTLADSTTTSAATLATADYTPAGSVGVTLKNNTIAEITGVGTLPSKAADSFTANTPTVIDTTKFNAGSAPSYSHSGFSGGSLGSASTSTFAKTGITATVGTGTDSETLIFSNASTASAVTAQGKFTAAVYGTDSFSAGTLPSLGDGFYTAGSAATYKEGTFSPGSLPTKANKTVAIDTTSFTGTTVEDFQVTGVSYVKPIVSAATFTPVDAKLGFSGTKVAGALVTGVSYDKAGVSGASVNIEDVSLDVGDITVPGQTITVNPTTE